MYLRILKEISFCFHPIVCYLKEQNRYLFLVFKVAVLYLLTCYEVTFLMNGIYNHLHANKIHNKFTDLIVMNFLFIYSTPL